MNKVFTQALRKMRNSSIFLLGLLLPLTGFAEVDTSILKQGIFTPVATDQSIAYLTQLFGGVGNVLHGGGGQLLAFVFVAFNLAIWVLAGSFVIYTTLISVVGAAHEGEFMGKKMHSMVPVRVVAGVAMLLPKFSGYSFIQLLVMWVVVQGVGLADNVWGSAIDFFRSGGTMYTRTALGGGNTTPSPYDVRLLADTQSDMAKLLSAQVCMYSLQDAEKKQNTANKVTAPVSQGRYITQAVAPDATYPTGVNGVMSFGSDSKNTLCGSFSYPYRKEAAVTSLATEISPIAYSIFQTGLTLGSGCLTAQANPLAGTGCPESTSLVTAMSDYLSTMTYVKQSELMAVAANSTVSSTDPFAQAKAEGWILAAKYYAKIAQINQSGTNSLLTSTDYPLFDSAATSVAPPQPQASPPPLPLSPDLKTVLGTANTTNLNNLLLTTQANSSQNPIGYVPQMEVIANSMYGSTAGGQQCSNTGQHPAGSICDIQEKINHLKNTYMNQRVDATGNNIIDADVFDLMKSPVNAWFNVVLNPGTTAYQDPVARMRAIGLDMISAANTFWENATHDVFMILGVSAALVSTTLIASAVGFGMMDVPGGSTGANLNAALSTSLQLAFQIIMARVFWYLPLGIALSTPIFVLGATLAVYIPLIPYMLFTFAALGWFILVLESMVAAPLVALGVTHPEGHDLLGKSDQAIMLLLGVFLKPVLLIIGLLAGIILTFVAANLFDAGFFHLMYGQLTDSSSGGSGGAQFVVIIGMLVIYTMTMMAIVDQCFSLIYVLPDKITRWIGGHPEQSAEGGMLQQVKSGYEGKVGEGAQGGGQTVSAVKSSGITAQAPPPAEKKQAGLATTNTPAPPGGAPPGGAPGGGGDDGGGGGGGKGSAQPAINVSEVREEKKMPVPSPPSSPTGSSASSAPAARPSSRSSDAPPS